MAGSRVSHVFICDGSDQFDESILGRRRGILCSPSNTPGDVSGGLVAGRDVVDCPGRPTDVACMVARAMARVDSASTPGGEGGKQQHTTPLLVSGVVVA